MEHRQLQEVAHPPRINGDSVLLRPQPLINTQPSTAAAQEGVLRGFARKGAPFHDVVMIALLRKEWPPMQRLDRPGASVAAQNALS